MAQYFYDRVALFVDGVAYQPLGQIRSFSMDISYNTVITPGFSPTRVQPGKTIGNKQINNLSWTEYLSPLADFFNWGTFGVANPNSVLLVVPISLAKGVPNAPSFTVTGYDVISDTRSAPSEGEPMTRVLVFNALDSSNS